MNILILLLGFMGSSYILFLAQTGRRHRICDNPVYTALSMAFLLMGVVSLLAVRCSQFSLPLVAVAMFVVSVLLSFIGNYLGNREEQNYGATRSSSSLIIISGGFLCVALYAFFPTYYLLGGRDHGVYLLFSYHINQTGGLNLDLPWLREAYEQYGDSIKLGYDGIYSALERKLSSDPAKLIPQFVHLFPSYGAIGAAIAGVEGIVRTNVVIMFFALWSFYTVARRFMMNWAAVLATFLLMINPAFLWVGRATFTEPLQVFILFFGLHLFFNALKFKSTSWAGIAGLVLGVAVTNRLSGGLNVIVIISGVLYIILNQPDSRRIAWAFVVGYFTAASIGFVDGYVHSYPYFTDLWKKGGLKLIIFLNYSVMVGVTILLCIQLQGGVGQQILKVLKKIILPVTFLLIGWVLFRYQLADGEHASFSLRSVKELCWYVTGGIMVFAIMSFLFAKKENDWLYLFLIGICLSLTLFIYTWNPAIHPDHFWASRRWVVFCIPLIMFGFGKTMSGMYDVFIKSGFSTLTTAFIVGVPVCWYIVNTFMLASPFLFTSLLHSHPEGYTRASNNIKKLQNTGVYLTRDRQAGSYLTYMYGIPTVMVTRRGLQRISQGQLAHQPAFGLGKDVSGGTDNFRFCGDYTEQVMGGRPSQLTRMCTDLTPGFTVDPSACQSIALRAVSGSFYTKVGQKDMKAGTLTSDGKAGFLQFGPYIATGPGKYRVLWRGEVLQAKNASIGVVDIVNNLGQHTVISKEIKKEASAPYPFATAFLDFDLKEPASDLEYRFYVNEGVIVKLHSVELQCAQKNQQ